jgi:DNA-binding response OmpR family regulator
VKVLILDDDAISRATIASMCERAGLDALETGDRQTAQATLTAEQSGIELVILNWPLAGTGGLGELRGTMSPAKSRGIPVLMLYIEPTCTSEFLKASIVAGATHHLAKPFDLREFRQKVAEVRAATEA